MKDNFEQTKYDLSKARRKYATLFDKYFKAKEENKKEILIKIEQARLEKNELETKLERMKEERYDFILDNPTIAKQIGKKVC